MEAKATVMGKEMREVGYEEGYQAGIKEVEGRIMGFWKWYFKGILTKLTDPMFEAVLGICTAIFSFAFGLGLGLCDGVPFFWLLLGIPIGITIYAHALYRSES